MMSTRTVAQAFTNNSDANFRLWGKWISDGYAAFNWVKVTQTGQVNWASVLAPTAATTYTGFEVWRMDDALQSTAPVYLKIEYGSGAVAATPALALTFGSGSDGAGNLTGIFYTRTVFAATGGVTTAVSSYASGASNRIDFVMAKNVSQAMLISIERTHDATGADSSVGLMVFSCLQATWSSRQANFAGLQPTTYAAVNCNTPPSGSGALAPDIHLFPVRCWTPGESFPSENLCGGITADFSNDAQYSVVGYDGTTRIYLCCGGSYPGSITTSGQAAKAMLRYD